MTSIGNDADELARKEFSPLSYVMEPWLIAPSLAILWAWRGVGKSWVALSIAHACAIGGSFLGWKAPRQFRTCLIDGELGQRFVIERLLKVDSSAEASADGKNLRIVTFEDAPKNIIWNLATAEGQAVYTEIIADYDLVIVDNIATCVRPGGKGLTTDVETWASVQTWAIAQRSKGKSILFVDHAGKGGSQRGTSTKEDVMDTIMSLTRDAEYEASFGCEFNLRFEKSRHFFGDQAQSMRVALRDTYDGKLDWTWRPLKDHVEEKVVSLLRKKRSIPEILSAVNISRNRIADIKAKMKEEEDETQDYPRSSGGEDRDDPF